ncbi:fimbrial chaperone protein [Acinetobacter calcoaceticus]|uniref:Fimbrial chaperone protein n=1 Tax=Acinetobacter calcoaceticus TaxID=471 RepID=A0A4R1XF45_ACICA|nr:fimbrial chaperone protein [Acinetobacter calcoaceticus]
MKFYINNPILLIMSITALQIPTLSNAGMVMTGTRVIFNAQQAEKTIQLNNKDDHANLVQVWIDDGDESSNAETSQAPFIANPQIFKVGALQGQIVRLIYTGDVARLPSDRESLFYLNFSEITMSNNKDLDQNRLMLMVKNRLKLFYRPEGLSSSASDMVALMNYKIDTSTPGQPLLQIYNNSPYHANLSKISLLQQSKVIVTDDSKIIAPRSSMQLKLENKVFDPAKTQLQIVLINDYGTTALYQLKPAQN